MIDSIKLEPGITGKNLVKIVFTPQASNPASQFSVEAVFEVQRVDTFLSDKDPIGAFLLSSTRTDTREKYKLTEPQRDLLVAAALEKVADN